ncbi:MAG: PEGA domain-containing protein [Deltaproteobacteria bacterium]|nr:PEGA domain-containing protein [Deltaproteobacteria bacterium]
MRGVGVSLLLGCATLSASVAHARDAEVMVAAIAIAADGGSAPVAVEVARVAHETLAHDRDVRQLDLERVLDGGDPLWVSKLQAAEAATRKGTSALESVELPVAAEAFAEAVVAYEQAVAGMRDLTPLVEVFGRQGVVFTLQGDKKNAEEAFARALALDPAWRIEGTAPSKARAAFEVTVKAQKNAGQGTVTVYATTGAAEVWVDGVFRGVAPLTLDARAGRHYVRVARDGYLAHGSAVEVRRGSEATVQTSLRPTSRLAKLEELSHRVARSKESVGPVAELAAWLQVDRLLVLLVEDSGGSALVTGTLVDGVNGQQRARASKAFSPRDSFFERDVRNFLRERLAPGASEGADAPRPERTPPPDGDGPPTPSLLPGEAERVEAPGAVVGGWVLLGLSAVPIGTGIGFGIASLNYYDAFRNKLPDQVDPNLNPLRTTWLTMSIITDVSWALAIGMVAGGSAALVIGYDEWAAREEVATP